MLREKELAPREGQTSSSAAPPRPTNRQTTLARTQQPDLCGRHLKGVGQASSPRIPDDDDDDDDDDDGDHVMCKST